MPTNTPSTAISLTVFVVLSSILTDRTILSPVISRTSLFQSTGMPGLLQALLEPRLGAEAVPPMDQRDLRAEVVEVERVGDRGVAAADNDHLLAVLEEVPVAGGAVAHAPAVKLLRARRVQRPVAHARGEQKPTGDIDGVVRLEVDPAVLPVPRRFGHIFTHMDLSILRRLLGDEVHKALAADAHEAGIVLHHRA